MMKNEKLIAFVVLCLSASKPFLFSAYSQGFGSSGQDNLMVENSGSIVRLTGALTLTS